MKFKASTKKNYSANITVGAASHLTLETHLQYMTVSKWGVGRLGLTGTILNWTSNVAVKLYYWRVLRSTLGKQINKLTQVMLVLTKKAPLIPKFFFFF